MNALPAAPSVPADDAGARVVTLEAWTVPYTEPNDHGSTRYVAMCRVRDSDGVVGWGEAVTIQEEAARATTVVLRAWAQSLPGTSATPAAVRAAVADRAWWYGTGGGLSGFATAALDTAMWDLAARRAGVPLTRHLADADAGAADAAAHADGLPVVVTTHAVLADLVEQAEVLGRWRAELGAVGVKVGFGKAGDARLGFDPGRDEAFVAALRAAVGPDAQIMVDVSPRVRWTVEEAIDRVLAFERHGLHWVEEPLGADDPAGYARLCAETSALVAYGEREWTLAGMRRLLDSGALDVLGVDAGRAGGVTDFVGAAAHAHRVGRQINAHAFAGPVSYAAGLACSLVSPACHQFEVAPLRNSLMTDLADVPRPVAGRVTALPGPGLGVAIDADAVLAAAVD